MPDKENERKKTVKEWNADMWAKYMRNSKLGTYQKMTLVALDMDRLRDAEDTIIARSQHVSKEEKQIYTDRLRNWEQVNFLSLVSAVAAQTGADPEQIANKETRTPEQQQALIEESARMQIARMDAFWNSNYFAALNILYDTKSVFDPDPDHPEEYVNADDPDAWGFKESFIWYYFTTRPDLRPSDENSITDADKKEIIETFKRFDAFIASYFGDIETAKHCEDKEYREAIQAFISQENPADAQEIIEQLTSILPTKYIMPNNKLANIMTRDIFNIGEVTLNVSKAGSKKPIETTCILTYDGDNVKLSGRQPFTEYDRNVYNAVSSLYVYGDPSHVVTPAMVYRAMTGLTGTEKPTPGQLAAVTRSLDKMRFIRTRIDCTAELRARRITLDSKQINGGEIDTNLLMAKWITVEAGGQRVKALKIIDTPILLEYAAAVKQILTLPASMLDVKELDSSGRITTRSLSNTETRILIKGYLLRRIEGLKGKNGLSNPIVALYDYQKDGEIHPGLYSIAGKPDAERKEMQRMREDVEKMLDYWKASGYIAGYELQTQQRKITGYKIII